MVQEVSTEKWAKKYVEKEHGGFFIKLTFLAGIPDRLVLIQGGRAGFIETKTPIGHLSVIQKWWIDKLVNLGFPCACLSDKSAIKAFVDGMRDYESSKP